MDELTQAISRQNAASDPKRSTWVSANAGSGKTRVLTDRVARLLLSGVSPANILCLTFTKAAAAEMQSRLFGRLGAWTMMPDDALIESLSQIGEATDSQNLNDTRILFARALETPGGLKIQTIHAFCASMLRRFPVEAKVSPQFKEIEDRDAALLRSEVLEQVVMDDHSGRFAMLAGQISDEDDLDKIASAVFKNRDAIGRFDRDVLAQSMGITGRETIEEINDEALAAIDVDIFTNLLGVTRQHSTSKDRIEKMAAFVKNAAGATGPELGRAIEKASLTAAGALSAKSYFLGAKITNKAPEIVDAIENIKEIIAAARNKRFSLLTLNRTEALFDFANAFVPAYKARKAELGVLEFDDLIDKANDLLGKTDVANWVRFRIDSGIDHILVDESQDTSPRQWQIVKTLESEFTDGQGKDRAPRTLFVVGDEKQSIFGFQGADPAEFNFMQRHFEARQKEVNQTLEIVGLEHSFRSAGPILQLVDRVFSEQGTGGLETPAIHRYFPDRPGRVDLWDVIPKAEKRDDGPWHVPDYDKRDPQPRDQLARQIAEFVRDELAKGRMIPDRDQGWRVLEPKDVLILLRQRSTMLAKLVEELKDCGVPVAGADRLVLGDALAVKDVLSLLTFIDNEDDDLALAQALRSPIFGLSEDDLFRLAQPRKGYLWEALRNSTHTAATELIHALREKADYWRPYELIEFILTEKSGRSKLVARLGRQCEDALDALLAEALTFESSRTPTLAQFLYWMQTGEVEIKREADVTANELRIMTVHGAKGLEAPLVIVPDMGLKNPKTGMVLQDGDRAIWAGTVAEGQPDYVTELRGAFKETETREFERLLYVALTRAESWLVLCGAGEIKEGQWFDRVSHAFEGLDALDGLTLHHDTYGPSLRNDIWQVKASDDRLAQASTPTFPEQLRPNPTKAEAKKTLKPSDLATPHALPGPDNEDADRAMQRGTIMHKMLELLPKCAATDRQAVAARIAGDDPDGPAIIATALDLIARPELAEIFAHGTLSEVAIAAPIPALGAPIKGVIDRIVVTETHIHAIDFKSHRTVPNTAQDIPLGILAQLAAYQAALVQIWPDKDIKLSILWTQTGNLMTVPHAQVNGVLQNLSSP